MIYSFGHGETMKTAYHYWIAVVDVAKTVSQQCLAVTTGKKLP